jgi:hypothetical protein
MECGSLSLQVEDLLADPVWPSKWPYGFEDFRPQDYSREVLNTLAQYQFSRRYMGV